MKMASWYINTSKSITKLVCDVDYEENINEVFNSVAHLSNDLRINNNW